jgi:molybdopterin converting factor small subunit
VSTIHLTFYGPIRHLLKREALDYEASPGKSLRDILLAIGVPSVQLVYTMVLVNNKKCDASHVPSEGDRVDVFQPVGGGQKRRQGMPGG